MLVDTNISIDEDITITNNITIENMVCLMISNFIFSLLLSFVIDLYNLNPLTANANIAGINNIFCNNKLINTNDIPFVSRLLQAVGSTHKRPAAHFRTSPVDSYSSPSYLTLTERSLGSRQVDRSESKHRVQRPS